MGGQRQILVLDDDKLLQGLAADELAANFGVIFCTTVQDALTALERTPDVAAAAKENCTVSRAMRTVETTVVGILEQ